MGQLVHLVNRVKEQYFVLNFQLYKGNKKMIRFEYHLFVLNKLQGSCQVSVRFLSEKYIIL